MPKSSDDPPDDFDRWFEANARCGNCVFFERGLFDDSGRCRNQIVPVVDVQADRERCGAGYHEWNPDEATRPAFEAALISYLEWWERTFDT